MGFLNHIRVLNIKIISQINLMCFSVAFFYNFFYVENELSCEGKEKALLRIEILKVCKKIVK